MSETECPALTEPQVWRLHARSDAEQGIDPGEFCTTQRVAGIGWRVEPDTDHMLWDDYLRLAKERYASSNGWWAAINAVKNRMAVGDLCWTRTRSGKYWLGRIEDDWFYRNAEAHLAADIVNIRPCRWFEVGDLYEVPGKVVNPFRASRTVQKIDSDAIRLFSMLMYNSLASEETYTLPDVRCDLFAMLCPEDCEDLVGVYLQTRGFVLFPATCKADTKQFEFVLRHRLTGRYAAVQVKQGRSSLDCGDYTSFDGDVFLFQTADLYAGSPPPNVHCLARCDMESFCLEHLHLLPARIQRWVSIMRLMQGED